MGPGQYIPWWGKKSEHSQIFSINSNDILLLFLKKKWCLVWIMPDSSDLGWWLHWQFYAVFLAIVRQCCSFGMLLKSYFSLQTWNSLVISKPVEPSSNSKMEIHLLWLLELGIWNFVCGGKITCQENIFSRMEKSICLTRQGPDHHVSCWLSLTAACETTHLY